jgi:hypothetical protein
MNDYLLGFAWPRFLLLALEEEMNSIKFLMLFFDGPDQRLPLFFILGDVLLMLFDAVLIVLS